VLGLPLFYSGLRITRGDGVMLLAPSRASITPTAHTLWEHSLLAKGPARLAQKLRISPHRYLNNQLSARISAI
jgi:hypothetical protein